MSQEYLVIETHGGAEYATITMNEDGTNKVFNNIKDAITEQSDCQDAIIISLKSDDNVIDMAKEIAQISAIISHSLFNEIHSKLNAGAMTTFETVANWSWEFYKLHTNTNWDEEENGREEQIISFAEQQLTK